MATTGLKTDPSLPALPIIGKRGDPLRKSLDRLERLLEDAFEGTVQRLLRPRLQPAQLARAAVRELERQRVIGPDGPVVPNTFRIALHPRDYAGFGQYQRPLERELARYLTRYAHDRGWRPAGPVSVALVERPNVPVAWPQVSAELRDEADPLDLEAPTDRLAPPTEPMPRAERPSRPEPARPPLGWLEAADGQRFVLQPGLVRIGRDLENDVVLSDHRVSRFHAVVEPRGDRVVLRDLGSTNGTRVANRAGQQWELRDGDAVSLGGYLLTFRRG